MKLYKLLARSALSIVTRQEGRVGNQLLALHASCFLAAMTILAISGLLAFASISLIDFDFGSLSAKIRILIVVVPIWIVHYRLILRIARSDEIDGAPFVSARPIVWGLIVTALWLALSAVAVANFGR